MNVSLPYQQVMAGLSATESDRSLIAYAKLLIKLGIIAKCQFVHVRTPQRVAEERISDAEVLDQCQRMIAGQFTATESQGQQVCQVITAQSRIDALIEFAATHQCDLALLGHRKCQTGCRSLARRMAMIAPCSVWLVPEGSAISISKMLVPVDFSNHSADSLSMATAIASAAKLQECQAVHVYSDPQVIRYDDHDWEMRNSEKQAFKDFLRPINCHGVTVEPLFVEGNSVAGTVLYTAQQNVADLLVVNTRGRSRSAAILLGSVTSQLMTESPIAVLAVKHYGAAMNLLEALKKSAFWSRPNPHTN